MKLLKTKYTILFSILLLTIIFLTDKYSIDNVYAHNDPIDCTGSGLGIRLYTDKQSVYINDNIAYTLAVFNSPNSASIICNVTNISINLITPDGISHNITPIRNSLLAGESDTYTNIINYSARSQDIVSGILTASANDTGNIHQNDTDSIGGGNQSVNVIVNSTIEITSTPSSTNTPTITPSYSPTITVAVPNSPPTFTPTPTIINGGGGGPVPPPIVPVIIATSTPLFIFTPFFPITGFN